MGDFMKPENTFEYKVEEIVGDELVQKSRMDREIGDRCEICHEFVGDQDAVVLECPEDFANTHIHNDRVNLVKVWHRTCFEREYKITLPVFRV